MRMNASAWAGRRVTALSSAFPIEVWTGTANGGTKDTNSCGSWGATASFGNTGNALGTTNWTAYTSQSCAQSHRLYCLEQ